MIAMSSLPRSCEAVARDPECHDPRFFGKEASLAERCDHFDEIRNVVPRTPQGCEEYLKTHGHWLHLRMCLVCGHVGCCDQSPGKHATKHFHSTQHAMMKSFQPGEDWGWCYVDELFFEPAPQAE
jgi:hypothetical protein